jgi:F0F1-type ATP synthase assembly protein I
LRKLPRSGGDQFNDPLQMGMTIVGVTVVFGGFGWWIDSLIGTFPVLMIIGAVVGLFGILYLTVMRLKESDRKKKIPENSPQK